MRSRVIGADDERNFVGAVFAALLIGAALFLASCGNTGQAPEPTPPQWVLNPPGTVSNAGSMEMSATMNGVYPGRRDRLEVLVRVLDPQGAPVFGQSVVFQADREGAEFTPKPPAETSLAQAGYPAGISLTDTNGMASVVLRAPVEPGRMAVTAVAIGLRLSGLIFIEVFPNGFFPSEGGKITVVPASIEVTQPMPGFELNFVIVGGVPFDAPQPPYLLTTASSGIGTAELVFEGLFPAFIRYTLTGSGSGTHTFAVVDSEGHSFTASVKAEHNPLQLTPPTSAIQAGGQEIFVVNGGLPPYDCSASTGTLSPQEVANEGGRTTYTAPAVVEAATVNIVCVDGAGQTAAATVTVSPPAPTPVPTGTPVPTPTPGAPVVVPASQTMTLGQGRIFAISGGAAPFAVTANGGTVSPSTIPNAGGTFVYTAIIAGSFTSFVSAKNGVVASFTTINQAPTPTPAP